MTRRTLRHISLTLVIGVFWPVRILSVEAQVSRDAEALQRAAVAASDTVNVPAPTGEENADRINVQAAFDAVQAGGTVLFAPGTYLLGAGASLTVPDVTVLGHPDGTILRGCDPDAFAVEYSEVDSVLFGCTGLYVQAERQTIRGLTFEYAWHGIVVGPYPTTQEEGAALQASGELPAAYPAGGQRIEGNTFRATPNGLRVLGTGGDLSVVRNNDFIDVFHAIGIYGAPLHFLDNRVTVTDPAGVPFSRHPGSAVIVSPGQTDCAGHVVAGNRIEGYPDPIYVLVDRGETCRGVEIRDNAIHAARVKVPQAYGGYTPTTEDSTMVGAPITLMNRPEPGPGMPEAEAEGILDEVLVQGNQIVGAEGLGILIQNVSRSRIAGNRIVGVQRRAPFPGLTWDGFEQRWEDANGSAIWVSPGSDGNEIEGNTFEDIAGSAVFLEGASNRVELRSANDAVRDLGTGNHVTRDTGVPRDSGAAARQPPQTETAQDWTDSSPHEIRYVTVAPEVRLEVLDWGGDGLPLVFLAGANFNAHSFDDFAPRFTDTRRVLGITRRGHGSSSWPDSGYDLPTLVEDIRVVLDGLGIDRAIIAGHSMAGSEMTLLATEFPDRVVGLIYIDAGHDPTDIGRLRVPELCSFGGLVEAMERTFENPELVRRTQRHTGEDGARRPFASAAAVARIDASLPSPDYSGVRAPALGIYYVPERTEDVFMGVDEQPAACVAAFHRYIHGGIAAFTEGVEQATVVALSDTNHNIHLASPAALEAVMRQWLDSHAAPDPTDRLVREHMEELGIPAVSLVVMRHGVVLREAAYGWPSLELDVPATPATVFPYASMAKVFTGTAILRLVQDGRLSLDGRIGALLTDLPPAWSDVTVRQLLAHTSGLPDLNRERRFRNPFVSQWASRAAALEALAGQPLERAPGTGYSYNQTNYLLLGMLLDRVDGRTVEEYVAEEIAAPLGLASLAYGDSRVPIAGRASWYSRLESSDGELRVVAPRPLWIEYPPFLHPAAGLNGTARDLARFVAALASGSLLDDAHRHEMWTAVPLADGTTFRFEDGVTGAGLGWWVHDDPSHPWVGMGGAASGVVRLYVNEGLTIAVLTNLQGAEPEAIVSGIADIYLRAAATSNRNEANDPISSASDSVRDLGADNRVSRPARATDAGPSFVHVAPPTGVRERDRASILAALEQVEPSGTIQFAPGTYLVGETIRIGTPRITLRGHAGGTVLRGCDPDEQEEVERSAVRALGSRDQNTYQAMRRRCGLLELTGGNVTVRGLTFEHSRRGLVLGCCEGEEVSDDGGYLIEGNTFRNSANGIRASLVSAEPTVIRDNRFVNVFHALSAGVSHVHMLDNDISVPEPLRVPGTGHPGFAIGIRPPPPRPTDGPGTGAPVCEQNVIAGNRIEGHTDGILLRAFEAGTSCRDNTIRDNVIQVRRVRFPVPWLYAGLLPLTNEADTTFVGVPLGLLNSAARAGSGDAGSGAVEYNRIEGNRILGAHGVGIQVLAASRNRIVGNTLAGIRRRDPFPGNITTGSQDWREANGSGIWISPGSEENEILGNTFEDIRSAAIVLEGNRNRVETRTSDVVRDLGNGNEVIDRTDETQQTTPPADPAGLGVARQPALADTISDLAVESMALWNRLDPDAWLALFGDSVRWYYGATSLDRAGVEDMVRGLMSFTREADYRVLSEPDVEVLGPDAAVASFAMVQSATGVNGEELDEPTGLTFVYERREGNWKIGRVHESMGVPPDSVVAETILSRTRELAGAWERLDADAYLAHFSEDLTFYFEGSRLSRTEFETVVRQAIGSLRESTFEVLNPEVEVLGPNAAVISFELREVMVDASGASTDLRGVLTLVFERRLGQWLVVRAHETLRPPDGQ